MVIRIRLFHGRLKKIDDFGAPKLVRRFDGDELAVHGVSEGTHINGSLIHYLGRRLLFYRVKWAGGSDIAVADLSAKYEVERTTMLPLFHDRAKIAREDPRPFIYGGRLHVSFVGVESSRGELAINQLFARLADDLSIEEIFAPHWPGRRGWEKNWTFFDRDGDLLAIYSISPHVVLRIVGNNAEEVARSHGPPNWSGGHLRGGASPVRLGSEYLCWFHGMAEPPHFMARGRRRYSVGAYMFAAEPPFSVTRYSPEPLLWADTRTRPKTVWADVVFPVGAVFEGNDWLVSMGVHDSWNEIVKWNSADVERALRAV
jgi:predicted GH43/DUF377 family glycosyl hydrolase